MKKLKAFTLAETLITLSILGVVAAVLVPSIINNYKQRLTITKLKRAYAVLEKAATNIAVSSGCVGQTFACTGLLDMADTFSKGDPLLLVQKFNELSGMNGKIVRLGDYGGTYYMTYKLYCAKQECSTSSDNVLNRTYDILTKDGIAYSIRNSDYNKGKITDPRPITVAVITDTSKNAKLVMGKNVFMFIMYDNFNVEPFVFGNASTANPLGKYNNSYVDTYCDNQTKPSGLNCAAKIVRDGWKINY